MRAGALTVLIILLAAPLAGCAGSDGDVTVDLTPEEIQELMDANMDDFMDNMTVTVVNNYHNNTTVVNQYNNTTTVDNSGTSTSSTTYNYNGTQPDSEIHVVRLQWDVHDMFPTLPPPKRENNFTVDYSYYDYATNDDRTDTFTLACSNFYDAPEPGSNGTGASYWQNNNNFWDWWDAIYNNTIRDLLDEKAWSNEVQNQCREENNNRVWDSGDFNQGDGFYDYSIAPVFYEMDLPEGTAISVLQVTTRHGYSWQDGGDSGSGNSSFSWSVNSMEREPCNDVSPIVHYYKEECGDYFGGWEDIHIDFQLHTSVYTDSIFTFTMYYELVPVVNSS